MTTNRSATAVAATSGVERDRRVMLILSLCVTCPLVALLPHGPLDGLQVATVMCGCQMALICLTLLVARDRQQGDRSEGAAHARGVLRALTLLGPQLCFGLVGLLVSCEWPRGAVVLPAVAAVSSACMIAFLWLALRDAEHELERTAA